LNSKVRTGLLIAIGGLLLIALGIFVVVSFLNIGFPGVTAAATPTAIPETKFMVAFANNDIAEGMVLTAEDVTLAEIPVQFAPRDVVTDLNSAVGRISKTDLVEGEMILEHNLVNLTGEAFDIAYVLDENHVLMAVAATDLMSRLSVIKRGDIVDILVTYQAKLTPVSAVEGGTGTDTGTDTTTAPTDETKIPGQAVTFTALQKLNITGIIVQVIKEEGADPAAAPTRSQTVVEAYLIALAPQDALVLKYIRDAGGNFDFVIRAPTSTGQFELTPVTARYIKELYGLDLLP
jgi:pilus assembly protein CpaB